MTTQSRQYGDGDATYQAAGGLEGLTRLSNRFYDLMERLPEAQRLREMHPQDLTESRQKLAYFLSGWTGGPKLFSANYYPINVPQAHAHLPVDEETTQAWLTCMDVALWQLEYPEDFRKYLIEQLSVPASRVLAVCKHHQAINN